MVLYYFAYGGNTNPRFISKKYPNIKFINQGILDNYQLKCHSVENELQMEHAYMDIISSETSQVYGVIYELTEQDLQQFDQQEKLNKLYKREIIKIRLQDKTYIDCWVYQMIDQEKRNVIKPTERYWNTCIYGYQYHNLPLQQLEQSVVS